MPLTDATVQCHCLDAPVREPISRVESGVFYNRVSKGDVREFVATRSDNQVKYILYGSQHHWPPPYNSSFGQSIF